jgi:hypothetical protein
MLQGLHDALEQQESSRGVGASRTATPRSVLAFGKRLAEMEVAGFCLLEQPSPLDPRALIRGTIAGRRARHARQDLPSPPTTTDRRADSQWWWT